MAGIVVDGAVVREDAADVGSRAGEGEAIVCVWVAGLLVSFRL